MFRNTYTNVVEVNLKWSQYIKRYMLLQIKEKNFIDKFKP